MLRVAIASEFDDYDGEVFRRLASLILGDEIVRWKTDLRFDGCRSVRKRAPLYLQRAAEAGIRYALLAVDNDGGARKHPEHVAAHDPLQESSNEEEGCRECWLQSCIPGAWDESGGRHCIAVPVQALVTWLIHVRGSPELLPSPEKVYNRRDLKVKFFGRPAPPMQTKVAMAAEVLAKPDALDRLRERPSFRRFEERLRSWKV